MSDKYLRNERQQLLNSIGTELSWGWSPAVDFASLLENRLHRAEDASAAQAEEQRRSAAEEKTPQKSQAEQSLDALIKQIQLSDEPKAPAPASTACGSDSDVHILVAGGSDIRHIFRTLSTLRAKQEAVKEDKASAKATASNNGDSTFHFYLYEPNLRIHCRHLFFLQWLLDSMFSLEELEERVLMFLDVYGNILNRDITSAQARSVLQRLLKGFQQEAGSELMKLVSFEEMKMKEKDFVEQQLRHWAKDSSKAPLTEQWVFRVRQEMAERYDNRDNVIDWDFVFGLTDYTNLLKFPEYRDWRKTGNAFDVCHINPRRGFDYQYVNPNKSLCHFDDRGNGVYAGDVKNGPFFALGAQTENDKIRYRTADGTCKYGNGVVAMHNVRAWLYTLMTGQPWPWEDHKYAWDDDAHYNRLPPGTPNSVAYQAQFPKVRFHLVGLSWDRFILRVREKKHPRMEGAFFGTSCTSSMTTEFFRDVMRAQGVVVAETAKFIVNAEEAAKKAYEQQIHQFASQAGWAEDAALTRKLHEGQPNEKEVQGSTRSAAQETSSRRYAMPYQIALVRK
ncbi:hypothetical protein STCU_00314 [Strigomonas culicis]|uniref:Dynein assembly factor 3, axonemal n=1 Tax=Strigomonas culicis TaxID=28005 RepID=S9UHD3_9TRYP|nr:hypothetical protein STCU_05294 [Strigomonas culicis]EPY30394.1 hypothetical protein STCU_04088 [Strigomonas culicis]EPY36972.1 hypothetical protein STCU_00314 [Strigomonas culicis]|eukprot:EPY28114.1 hypothetical protein STCU_05294 [Strigomonas culicis]